MVSNVLFFSAVAVAIPSPWRHVFTLGGVVAVPLGNYECYYMWRLFKVSYYLASLIAKCDVNSRAATKWGAVSI